MQTAAKSQPIDAPAKSPAPNTHANSTPDPRREEGKTPMANRGADTRRHRTTESGKPRILVVDDEPDAVELIRYNLETGGFLVATAGDGSTALDKARSLHPSLIILDVMLPELDGMEVCKILRRDPITGSIPTR